MLKMIALAILVAGTVPGSAQEITSGFRLALDRWIKNTCPTVPNAALCITEFEELQRSVLAVDVQFRNIQDSPERTAALKGLASRFGILTQKYRQH